MAGHVGTICKDLIYVCDFIIYSFIPYVIISFIVEKFDISVPIPNFINVEFDLEASTYLYLCLMVLIAGVVKHRLIWIRKRWGNH